MDGDNDSYSDIASAPKVVHAEVRENFARNQDAHCEGNLCLRSQGVVYRLTICAAIAASKLSHFYQPLATLVEH